MTTMVGVGLAEAGDTVTMLPGKWTMQRYLIKIYLVNKLDQLRYATSDSLH